MLSFYVILVLFLRTQVLGDDQAFDASEILELFQKANLTQQVIQDCPDQSFVRLDNGFCYKWHPVEVSNVDDARRLCLRDHAILPLHSNQSSLDVFVNASDVLFYKYANQSYLKKKESEFNREIVLLYYMGYIKDRALPPDPTSGRMLTGWIPIDRRYVEGDLRYDEQYLNESICAIIYPDVSFCTVIMSPIHDDFKYIYDSKCEGGYHVFNVASTSDSLKVSRGQVVSQDYTSVLYKLHEYNLTDESQNCPDSSFYRLVNGVCYKWFLNNVSNVDDARRHCLGYEDQEYMKEYLFGYNEPKYSKSQLCSSIAVPNNLLVLGAPCDDQEYDYIYNIACQYYE
ncbi:uncharacterized protein LOC142350415 [Convolutriloba macropyga]|uniref:uncharacterized protein LOC142350415 n=1 Tax=Convolutriloba macropyga TaxID=536237 RepID=UPI003F51D216